MGCGCTKKKQEKQSYNILNVISDEIQGKADKVNKPTEQLRLSICKNCEQLFKLTGSCKKCGCFVRAKVKYAKSSCPIGKWE